VVTDLNISLSDASKQLPASLHFSFSRLDVAPTTLPTAPLTLPHDKANSLRWPQDMGATSSARQISVTNMAIGIEEQCFTGMISHTHTLSLSRFHVN
jgi:hypothetical protein